MSLYKPSLVYSALEVEILEQVNDHRASTGLNKLGILDDISHQAFLHSEHMRKNGEVCHHNFGNRFRILEEKLGAKSMGENVGYGYRTSEAFFRAWMKSQNHRKIIEGDNTHFGIAAIKTEERYYVTLIFIIK